MKEAGGGEEALSDLEGEATNKSPPSSNMLRNRTSTYLQDSSSSLSQKVHGLSQKHERDGSMGPKVLPFEFCALEVCLEAACSALELEVY